MLDQTTPTSGINEEMDTSTITDETEDQEFSNTDPEEEEDGNLEDEWEEEDKEEDGEEEEWEDKWNKDVDYKKKFYATTNLQNAEIKRLKEEIAMLKKSNTTKEEIAKIKERYDEEDIEVIESIISKKVENDRKKTLEEKELNIFLKKNPEITEPELKHVKDLQKNYWYSLQAAYDKINVVKDDNKTSWTLIWSSLGDGWVGTGWKAKWDDNDKAYQDLLKNYWVR